MDVASKFAKLLDFAVGAVSFHFEIHRRRPQQEPFVPKTSVMESHIHIDEHHSLQFRPQCTCGPTKIHKTSKLLRVSELSWPIPRIKVSPSRPENDQEYRRGAWPPDADIVIRGF